MTLCPETSNLLSQPHGTARAPHPPLPALLLLTSAAGLPPQRPLGLPKVASPSPCFRWKHRCLSDPALVKTPPSSKSQKYYLKPGSGRLINVVRLRFLTRLFPVQQADALYEYFLIFPPVCYESQQKQTTQYILSSVNIRVTGTMFSISSTDMLVIDRVSSLQIGPDPLACPFVWLCWLWCFCQAQECPSVRRSFPKLLIPQVPHPPSSIVNSFWPFLNLFLLLACTVSGSDSLPLGKQDVLPCFKIPLSIQSCHKIQVLFCIFPLPLHTSSLRIEALFFLVTVT